MHVWLMQQLKWLGLLSLNAISIGAVVDLNLVNLEFAADT
jgi:hypothetical protein